MDKENLLTLQEAKRVDSLLQDYNIKSGNLVAVYTDTADVSINDFRDSVYVLFGVPGKDIYSYILMLSRRNSQVFSTVNKKATPFSSQQQLIGILEAGIPALKEKRREEGITLICKKAIEFLDKLPKR